MSADHITDITTDPIALGDHPARLGDVPLTTCWRVRNQTLFIYEVDTPELEKLIPQELSVQEVRPGIGLLTIETLQYPPGHFGEASETYEMVLAVVVEPDLGLPMPVPRFSLSVFSILSSSAAFVARERVLLRTPMMHAPDLVTEFGSDGSSVEVRDGNRLVVSCRNTATAPAFEPKVAWGLIYTNMNDQLHRGAFRWQGDLFEHQRHGDHGRLHPHPVFCGLELGRVRGCYRQMAARPDLPTKIGYYHFGPMESR